jgi:outer membrane protein assembly factor BamB
MGQTPCYANGKLFGIHMSGYLRAMDAKTGKLLWKQKVAGTTPTQRGQNCCVMFIGGVVMTGNHAGTFYACDPETGAVLWKGTCDPDIDPQRWAHDGKEYGFVKNGNTYSCFEPKTGKELWKLSPPAGGTLLGFNSWIVGNTVAVLQGRDAKSAPMKGGQDFVSIALYKLTPEKAEKIWEVPCPGPIEGRWGGGLVPLEKYVAVFSYRLGEIHKGWLLDRATGKQVAVAVDVSGPSNHGHIEVADGRLFIRPDGVHGVIDLSMLGTTPETFKVLGKGNWGPKIPHTSSYASKAQTMPIVDGRMYIRGADGIYCYDLRKAAP